MAYDDGLAERVRQLLDGPAVPVEKKMFGGIAYMLNGNFACGINQENLIVRVGPERYAEALAQPHTREMDFTGRPMKGWIFVQPEGYAEDADLAAWVQLGVAHALSLPPK